MKKILLSLLIGLFFLPTIVLADGCIFPPDDSYMYETGQKAVILFDDNQETLVISTSFAGDAKDFSWIIPTPNQPEVSKLSKEIFTNLEELTEVEEGYYQASGFSATKDSLESSVEILEQKTLGYYEVTVLKATDKNALYDWFKENSYTYPQEGKYILDDYIRLGWVFTAVKITDEALSHSGLTDKINEGEIAPLKFVFNSNKIVYPLKITGIARFYEQQKAADDNYLDVDDQGNEIITYSPSYYDPNSMPITLYIFADHKKKITGFETKYANWIKAKDINKLGVDEEGNNWVNVDKKFYLTKLNDIQALAKMDEDLFPIDSDDNKKVGVKSWLEIMFPILVLLVPFILFLMFVVPIYWQFKKIAKFWRVTLWTFQITSFIIFAVPIIITILFILYSMLFLFGSMSLYFGSIISNTVICLILLGVLMTGLAVLIFENIWQKKNIH